MYQIQQVVKSDFFLIVLAFYEHIHLGTNQSVRNLLCFSSRCEDSIIIIIINLFCFGIKT